MKKGFMRRGYSPLNKQMENKGRFIASCDSCTYFYSEELGVPEYCHNMGVTKFDMAETEEGRIYCTYWKHAGRKEEK
jgi:hypothetical protein